MYLLLPVSNVWIRVASSSLGFPLPLSSGIIGKCLYNCGAFASWLVIDQDTVIPAITAVPLW